MHDDDNISFRTGPIPVDRREIEVFVSCEGRVSAARLQGHLSQSALREAKAMAAEGLLHMEHKNKTYYFSMPPRIPRDTGCPIAAPRTIALGYRKGGILGL